MYCGKCNAYIPGDPGITACLECGTPIEESRGLREEIKRREQAAADKSLAAQRRSEHRYGYLSALLLSFFSPHLYRDVFRRWPGTCTLFLFFATGICMLPCTVAEYSRLCKGFEKEVKPCIEQMPRVTIHQGRVDFEGKSPQTIRETKKDQILVMFNRAADSMDLAAMPALALVTSREIAFRDQQGKVRVVPIMPVLSVVLTKELVLHWARQLLRWGPYFFYPLFWIFAWPLILLTVLVCALVTKLLAWPLGVRGTFGDYYRLTAVALVPMLWLDSLAMLWRTEGLPDWASLVVPLVFIVFGLWVNRVPKPKKEKARPA